MTPTDAPTQDVPRSSERRSWRDWLLDGLVWSYGRTMHDAWREAGWGFGHTFPGEPTPEHGGSRPVLLGVPVPTWLVRIDYIFHSNALETIDVRVGPGDGGSDHRPVVATLSFRRAPGENDER